MSMSFMSSISFMSSLHSTQIINIGDDKEAHFQNKDDKQMELPPDGAHRPLGKAVRHVVCLWRIWPSPRVSEGDVSGRQSWDRFPFWRQWWMRVHAHRELTPCTMSAGKPTASRPMDHQDSLPSTPVVRMDIIDERLRPDGRHS